MIRLFRVKITKILKKGYEIIGRGSLQYFLQAATPQTLLLPLIIILADLPRAKAKPVQNLHTHCTPVE